MWRRRFADTVGGLTGLISRVARIGGIGPARQRHHVLSQVLFVVGPLREALVARRRRQLQLDGHGLALHLSLYITIRVNRRHPIERL